MRHLAETRSETRAFTYLLHKRKVRQVFGQGGTAAPQDYYNFAEAKSFMPFDQPHVLDILNSYEVPVGRGKKYFATAG
ncbi:MAG: hypothetical protein ACRD8O_00560 [Bryobacteraceae bacterium]